MLRHALTLLAFAVVALSAVPARADVAKKPPIAKDVASGRVSARELSEAFTDVVDEVGPSVVEIDVTTGDERGTLLAWLEGRSSEVVVHHGMGSGVVLSSDGAILTNNHVVEQALTIDVRLPDGRLLPAKLAGRDPATDLAVLKVDAKDLVAARFADSDATKVGEWVVAIGSPFGLGRTVTTGIVSAKGRGSLGMSAVEDYLQTDASINPGNSGGPLATLDGHVVGINTMIVGRGSGIGFAIPSNMATRVAQQLLAKGKVERAYVGVGVQDVTPAIAAELKVPASGAILSAVAANGPAAKGNLKPGDVVSAVNGKTIRGAQDFVREVFSHDARATLELEVVRAGKRYATRVTLALRNDAPPPPIPAQQPVPASPNLGLGVVDVTAEQAAAHGLPAAASCVVASVALRSPADRAGLKAGDVIVEVDGAEGPKAADVVKALADGHALLRVRRGDKMLYVAVR